MVTFVYIVVTLLSFAFISAIDTYLYQEDFLVSISNLLFMEVGTGRLILILSFFFGLAYAGIVDYQKHKSNTNNSETN